MADPREPFVGRGVELELLGAELDLARAGNSRLVWIEAPAGMGKTTLVRRFLNDAETPVVLWAAAEETQVTQDWRVLDRLLAGVPGEMRSPAERLRARLSPDARPAVVRTELVEVLRGLEGAPTVVVLDDAACIDRASAETLRIAFRQLESDPLLVVATARPGADSDWEHLIATDDRARRVPLSGLSAEDVRRLAAAKGKPIEPLAARRVQRHTAGNPLYACALIEELDQAILARGRGPLPAPRSLTLAVGRRLSACSPPAQALVRAVAVLGSPASLDSARLLAGLEDPWPALEEAATKGLLVEVAGSSYAEVAFVRPLAAVAVYHQLSRGCRSHLHAQAMALTAGEARLRHQVEAARSVHSQAEAVAGQLEAQADQEMANGALRPAALHMDQAASLTSAGWLRSRRLLRAAEALLASGDVAAAAARWQEVEPGSGPRESLLAGQLTFLGGRASAAEQCLETAWGQSRQIGEPALAARAASTRAIVAVTRGHADVAAYWATKVEPAPGGGGAQYGLAACLGMVMAGRTNEALAGLTGMEQDPESTLARGLLRMWTDDLAGAADDLRAVGALTEGDGCLLQLANHVMGFLAEVEYRSGSWEDAITHAEVAAGASTEGGRPLDAAFIHAIAARPLLAMGAWTRADFHRPGLF